MENNITPNEVTLTQQESIKLTKNTRGYSWEIRTLDMDIERLEELNKKMSDKFGNKSISYDVENL